MGYFSDNLPGQDGGISTTPEPIDLNQSQEETSGGSEETSNTSTNDPLSALKNNLVENSPNAGNPQVTQETAFEQPDTQAGGNGPSKFAAGSFQVSSFILPENIQKALDFELQTFSDLTSKTVSEIEDAGRVQALAVFTQPRLDFDVVSQTGTKVYNSNLYSSIEQALVEDRISRSFSEALFQKALVSDSAFFNSAQASINENLAAAQNIIDTLEAIFAEIRKFDNVLSQGATKNFLKNSSLQKMSEIGSLEPLREGEEFYTTTVFDSLENFIIRAWSSFYENLDFTQLVKFKTKTSVMTMNLYFIQKFLSGGVYLGDWANCSIFPNDNTPIVSWDERKKVHTLDSIIPISGLVNETRVNYQKTSAAGTYIGYYESSLKEAYDTAGMTKLKWLMYLTSGVANEFLNSAGLARLTGTPVGNKFGAPNLRPRDIFGASLSFIDDETSFENSIVDDFLVTKTGGSRVDTASGDSGVSLFEGTNSSNLNSKTATQNFAFSVISNPLTNSMSGFENAISNAKTKSKDVIKFMSVLQSRDKSIKILTPRLLFTKIADEVASSLLEMASGAADSSKTVIAELALYAHLGKKGYDPNPLSPSSYDGDLRALLFDIVSNLAYSILQPNVTVNKAFAGTPTKTQVTIEKPGEAPEQITVTTKDVSEKQSNPPDAANQDTTKIRISNLSESDIDLFVKETSLPKRELLSAVLALDTNLNESISEIDSYEFSLIQFLVKNILEDKNCLSYRIAQIFADCHDEAYQISRSDSDAANFIDSDRRTLNKNADGAQLLAMIFEIAINLCGLFCDSQVQYSAIKVSDISSGQKKPTKSVSREEIIELIDSGEIKDDTFDEYYKSESAIVRYGSGTDSRNSIAARALKLLVQCSNSNSFDTAYGPNGDIPQLGPGVNDSIIITADEDGSNALSFLTVRQAMEKLAEQRDLPLASLLAHDSYIDYIEQNTSGLVSIANQILGNENRTETVQSFVDFAQSSIGKKYLKLGKNETATDRSVNISRIRYDKLVKQNQEFTKRLQRISAGELACVREVFKEFYQTPSETLVMPVVGLPAGMAKDYIIPKFGIVQGFSIPPDQMTIIIKIRAAKVFDEQVIGTIYRQLMLDEILDGFSFENFNLSQPPTGMQDIIENVVLIDGRSGSQFIQDSIDQDRARVILKNEVMSYLARKAMSVISPIDLFAEDISDESSEEVKRSSFSQTLAASFASVYGLPEDYFNEVFELVPVLRERRILGERRIVLPKMLDLTKPTSTQNLNRKPLSFGEAEMFTDVFSNLYFKSEQIVERVFEQVVFEKLMCLPFSPDEFPSYEDYALKGKDINFPSNNPNQYTTDFAKFDPTVAKFRFNTYEMFITPGTTLGKK